MERISTAIIGGGAAGLFCAAALAGENACKNICIFERGERLGRKFSATGNGQGNVTNLKVGKTDYFSLDKAAAERINAFIKRHGKEDMISFLEDLGGLFLPDGRGRVYPAGRQASAVTDLLRYRVAEKEIDVRLNAYVSEIAKAQGGGFEIKVRTAEGVKEFFADTAVLCAGGKAAKNFGTDGNGYTLAKAFGHTVTPLYPSLVQLKTDTRYLKPLKGIRAGDVLVTAYAGNNRLSEARGDVIFTDYGVSGDAIFRLSAFVADKIEFGKVRIEIDFLPDVSSERLREILERKRKSFPKLPEGELLCGILNNQIGRSVMKRCREERGTATEKVAEQIKTFSLSVTGSLGFDYAQVTKGGVPLSEVSDGLESKKIKGLYFAGEILDVDGECGGYNLQWAYTSARIVADEIIRMNKKEEVQ